MLKINWLTVCVLLRDTAVNTVKVIMGLIIAGLIYLFCMGFTLVIIISMEPIGNIQPLMTFLAIIEALASIWFGLNIIYKPEKISKMLPGN